MNLSDVIRAHDAAWDACTTDAEREAMRSAFVAAGWTICGHPSCPPHDCRADRREAGHHHLCDGPADHAPNYHVAENAGSGPIFCDGIRCDTCASTGYLIDQSYGNNDGQNITVQRCDACERFAGDIEAAAACAADLGYARLRWLEAGVWRVISAADVPPADAMIDEATDVEVIA